MEHLRKEREEEAKIMNNVGRGMEYLVVGLAFDKHLEVHAGCDTFARGHTPHTMASVVNQSPG